MKTITIDLKSFCLGACAVGTLLVLFNFKPADKTVPDCENCRYQVVAGDRETIIIDTQTGKFVLSPAYIGRPRWIRGDFDEIQAKEKD